MRTYIVSEKKYRYYGKLRPLKEIVEKYSINSLSLVKNRLNAGWKLKHALTYPEEGVFKKGERIGKLTTFKYDVVSRITSHDKPIWYCMCDCGAYVKVAVKHLLEFKPDSCGCSVGRPGIPTQDILLCAAYVKISFEYRNDIDERWDNFVKFKKEIGKPQYCHRLQKIDESKPIGPDNFQWKFDEGLIPYIKEYCMKKMKQ